MAKIQIAIAFILGLSNLCFAGFPEANNEYINDFAGIISAETEAELSNKLHNVEYYSGVEIVVATISSYGGYNTGSTSWESFSTGLFNKWGIGNLPDNNGVLLLVSTRDRKVRIELGGGHPKHYDSVAKEIISEVIVPSLKKGNYEEGILRGVDEIISAVTKPVSFFEWYKWYILAGMGALASTLIALYAQKHGKVGLFWFFLSIAGVLILRILGGLAQGNSSDGFGGGSSDGGGASGDF